MLTPHTAVLSLKHRAWEPQHYISQPPLLLEFWMRLVPTNEFYSQVMWKMERRLTAFFLRVWTKGDLTVAGLWPGLQVLSGHLVSVGGCDARAVSWIFLTSIL